VCAEGAPREVLTATNLRDVYGCDLTVSRTPPDGSVFVLPHGATSSAARASC